LGSRGLQWVEAEGRVPSPGACLEDRRRAGGNGVASKYYTFRERSSARRSKCTIYECDPIGSLRVRHPPATPQQTKTSLAARNTGNAKGRYRTQVATLNGSPFCVFFRSLRRSHSAPSATPRETPPGHAPTDQNLSCRKKHRKRKRPTPHPGGDPQRFPLLRLLFAFCGDPTPRPPRLRVRHPPATPQQTKTSLAARNTGNAKGRHRTQVATLNGSLFLRLLSFFAAIPLRALRDSA
jgi:hypothetical protein